MVIVMGAEPASTNDRPRPTWSVRSFAAFWNEPRTELVPAVLAPDVIGRWPGEQEPVRGPGPYTARLARLLELLPDVRLEVAESATDGEFTFVRWIMRATGLRGAFEMTGIDRVRVREGLVVENLIVYDTAQFAALTGHPSFDPDYQTGGPCSDSPLA